jgi:hypothetical protein
MNRSVLIDEIVTIVDLLSVAEREQFLYEALIRIRDMDLSTLRIELDEILSLRSKSEVRG